MGNSRLPSRALIRRRVEAALEAGVESHERKAAQAWLARSPRSRTHVVGRGKVGTGEHAHAWALVLRDELERRELVLEDRPEFTEHGRELLRALGVRLVVACLALILAPAAIAGDPPPPLPAPGVHKRPVLLPPDNRICIGRGTRIECAPAGKYARDVARRDLARFVRR